MNRNSNLDLFFTAATSFVSGMVIGLLLSRKMGAEEQKWIYDHTSEFSDWLNSRYITFLDLSNESLNTLRESIDSEVRKNIPDLYKATEDIPLNNNEILGI